MSPSAHHWQPFHLHGLPIAVACEVQTLHGRLAELAGAFPCSETSAGAAVCGFVRPYAQEQVLPTLSDAARRMERFDPALELYRDGRRHWIVDERWGMLEIDFARRYWRSWVLDGPAQDADELFEHAVLWPMAQLLRWQGLHLLPAASVAGDGGGAILLSAMGIEPELIYLLSQGWRIVGQRWTALRLEHGRIALLHMPGPVRRVRLPRSPGAMSDNPPEQRWADLCAGSAGATQHKVFCDAAVLIEPGRRAGLAVSALAPQVAQGRLRYAWPIADIHPSGQLERLTACIGQQCRCLQTQLSRDPGELASLLEPLLTPAPRRPVLCHAPR